MFRLSTEERYVDSWAELKAKPTQFARRWMGNRLSREEGLKIGDMWGLELDKADGKIITGLVRVHGKPDLVKLSGGQRTGRQNSDSSSNHFGGKSRQQSNG